MKELDLLSLPTSIVCAILSNIGKLSTLVRLDSAFCHHHHRAIWLELLASTQFTLSSPVNISDDNQQAWVAKRNVKCSSVIFTLNINAYKNVSDFLREMGGFVRKVYFGQGSKSHEVLLVAMHSKNLTHAIVQNSAVSCATREILLQNPNLQDFRCLSVTCAEEGIFAGVSLHKLKTLCISGPDCLKGFPWHPTAFSDSLQKVVWNYFDCYDEDWEALFKNCPGIRTFRADNLKWTTNEDIGNLGVGILNLSLSCNDTLTDEHVLSIMIRLSSLRTLNIQHCPLLTDQVLRHIAKYAGDRLEVMYIDIKHPESGETEESLEVFSQQCTKLRYLNINCYNRILCSGKGTSLIVGGCPRLETLVTNKYSAISENSRGFVSRFRPELKVLVHSPDTTFNILSMPVN